MNKIFPVLRKLLLFCIPFLLILASYLVLDPFMVLYKYDDYNKNFFVQKNLDYTATEKFLKNSKTVIYDSYIFGGSTSHYISPSIWKNHLVGQNKIFSFNVSTEHINGIWSKIRYLDSNGYKIENALLIFDTNATFGKFENDVPIFMKHYNIYPTPKLGFHYSFFLSFIDVKFLIPFIHYKATNKFFKYMDNVLIEKYYYFDPISNEYFNIGILDELKRDSINYYKARESNFGKRSGKNLESDSLINPEYVCMLNDIMSVFKHHNTDYKVIICPAYNQISFNKKDLIVIENIFGCKNVFDFSGENAITEQKSNFYDELHFKKYIGNELLEISYQEKSNE